MWRASCARTCSASRATRHDRLRRRANESRFRTRVVADLFAKRRIPKRSRWKPTHGTDTRFLHELPEVVRDAFLLFRLKDMDQKAIARAWRDGRMVRNTSRGPCVLPAAS